ncbi:uncharacterized protein LOC131051480 [Cryptomeria japonica]|uniref:uncharacterized protein LOC131051480 n=1 Tax=Cryptomeria japonica TaxID=3369 RepID=UPI0027DA238F|nr:uncharacterized protein LOC131051480 [Cryptomeria japonica]
MIFTAADLIGRQILRILKRISLDILGPCSVGTQSSSPVGVNSFKEDLYILLSADWTAILECKSSETSFLEKGPSIVGLRPALLERLAKSSSLPENGTERRRRRSAVQELRALPCWKGWKSPLLCRKMAQRDGGGEAQVKSCEHCLAGKAGKVLFSAGKWQREAEEEKRRSRAASIALLERLEKSSSLPENGTERRRRRSAGHELRALACWKGWKSPLLCRKMAQRDGGGEAQVKSCELTKFYKMLSFA